ncbi:MAG: hypothetical protein ACYTG5_14280 [Planctomycetota bacterium]|jgi:cytochrome c-type protein NapB
MKTTALLTLGLGTLGLGLLLVACSDEKEPEDIKISVPEVVGAYKSTASVRAERRLFDGAPPVVPHDNFGAKCISCHNRQGMNVPGIGFAPPPPHDNTKPPSSMSRCQQCHISAVSEDLFKENSFVGLRQDLRKGSRQTTYAPPVMPHQVLLRENCAACHTGPAAREEIRTTHPERLRCSQCHLQQHSVGEFTR